MATNKHLPALRTLHPLKPFFLCITVTSTYYASHMQYPCARQLTLRSWILPCAPSVQTVGLVPPFWGSISRTLSELNEVNNLDPAALAGLYGHGDVVTGGRGSSGIHFGGVQGGPEGAHALPGQHVPPLPCGINR